MNLLGHAGLPVLEIWILRLQKRVSLLCNVAESQVTWLVFIIQGEKDRATPPRELEWSIEHSRDVCLWHDLDFWGWHHYSMLTSSVGPQHSPAWWGNQNRSTDPLTLITISLDSGWQWLFCNSFKQAKPSFSHACFIISTPLALPSPSQWILCGLCEMWNSYKNIDMLEWRMRKKIHWAL